jgi:pyruvate formate lyase activating enzyme
MSDQMTGIILHLQRLSTEDGPGIRTSVFFKGCPLHCEWCHNPESISKTPQIQWLRERCIRCDSCKDICPQDNLWRTSEGLQIKRSGCTGCGICADACPANAIELLGTQLSVGELVSELVKDRTYYDKSSGGVTLSGGEPTLQIGYLIEVLERLKMEGIHTAVDTCGMCSASSLDRMLEHTDLILYDLKEIDSQRHKQFTGQPNDLILDNLQYIGRQIRERKPDKRLWVRTPLITGKTATHENIQGIGSFIADELADVIERWELCAFNNLCKDKYARLDQDWEFADVPLLTQAELDDLAEIAQDSGVRPDIVFATGATQVQG